MNDIDPHELQNKMNQQLLLLVDGRTRRTPAIDPHTYLDIDVLRNLDTIHTAALRHEGWELKTVRSADVNDDDNDGLGLSKHSRPGLRRCCRRICGLRQKKRERAKIAVSARYCVKRYGLVDGERTAVLTVGIFKDELVCALPFVKGTGPGQVFEVLNLEGELCQLRMKRVPINHRHGLSKFVDKTWQDDFLDFPENFSFRAEDLVAAFHQQDSKKSAVQSVCQTYEVQEEKEDKENIKKESSGVEKKLAAEEETMPVSPRPAVPSDGSLVEPPCAEALRDSQDQEASPSLRAAKSDEPSVPSDTELRSFRPIRHEEEGIKAASVDHVLQSAASEDSLVVSEGIDLPGSVPKIVPDSEVAAPTCDELLAAFSDMAAPAAGGGGQVMPWGTAPTVEPLAAPSTTEPKPGLSATELKPDSIAASSKTEPGGDAVSE